MDGTINAWAECLEEDLKNGLFIFEDFIQAVNEAIREPVFNRIDYADFYAKAFEKGHARKIREINKRETRNVYAINNTGEKKPWSEIKEILTEVQKHE